MKKNEAPVKTSGVTLKDIEAETDPVKREALEQQWWDELMELEGGCINAAPAPISEIAKANAKNQG